VSEGRSNAGPRHSSFIAGQQKKRKVETIWGKPAFVGCPSGASNAGEFEHFMARGEPRRKGKEERASANGVFT